jgi:hypothetical protein
MARNDVDLALRCGAPGELLNPRRPGTVHADTHPRTIAIEANHGDPNATAPVIYRLTSNAFQQKPLSGRDIPPCGLSRRSTGSRQSRHRVVLDRRYRAPP